MKEDKYYTPTIEEFYVGFEYEIQCIEIKELNVYEDVWEKSKYNISDYIGNNCNNGIVGDFVRVKYLDKVDIESLGWELTHQFDGAWWEIGKLISNAEEMWHPLGNWKYRLYFIKNNKVYIDARRSSNGGQVSIFSGTIKNKSELVKLMKQLGIQ